LLKVTPVPRPDFELVVYQVMIGRLATVADEGGASRMIMSSCLMTERSEI
jgi:hypothetical protein